MRPRLILAAVLTFAGLSRAAEPRADHPLAALSWFVGDKWVTELQSSDGRPLRVEARFEWGRTGRTLHYVIDFTTGDRTVTQYEGTYYWHPGRRQIAMVQVDRNGNVTESVAKVEEGTMTQENQSTQADGTTRPQRVSVVRQGDDAFAFKAMMQRDGRWVEAAAFTYQRERKPSP
jgi:hypothetical protein